MRFYIFRRSRAKAKEGRRLKPLLIKHPLEGTNELRKEGRHSETGAAELRRTILISNNNTSKSNESTLVYLPTRRVTYYTYTLLLNTTQGLIDTPAKEPFALLLPPPPPLRSINTIHRPIIHIRDSNRRRRSRRSEELVKQRRVISWIVIGHKEEQS